MQAVCAWWLGTHYLPQVRPHLQGFIIVKDLRLNLVTQSRIVALRLNYPCVIQLALQAGHSTTRLVLFVVDSVIAKPS